VTPSRASVVTLHTFGLRPHPCNPNPRHFCDNFGAPFEQRCRTRQSHAPHASLQRPASRATLGRHPITVPIARVRQRQVHHALPRRRQSLQLLPRVNRNARQSRRGSAAVFEMSRPNCNAQSVDASSPVPRTRLNATLGARLVQHSASSAGALATSPKRRSAASHGATSSRNTPSVDTPVRCAVANSTCAISTQCDAYAKSGNINSSLATLARRSRRARGASYAGLRACREACVVLQLRR